jgi:hypothetical protein
LAENVKGVRQFLEAGVVIRLEDLALDDGEINFDQANANAID